MNKNYYYNYFKIYHMQKSIYGLLLIGIILSSCGSGKKDQAGELNDKKAQLEKLKTQQKKINDQITELQVEIAKLDTSAAKAENAKLVALATIQPGSFNHYIELQGKIDAQNISYVA